jgi:hypothetical protein
VAGDDATDVILTMETDTTAAAAGAGMGSPGATAAATGPVAFMHDAVKAEVMGGAATAGAGPGGDGGVGGGSEAATGDDYYAGDSDVLMVPVSELGTTAEGSTPAGAAVAVVGDDAEPKGGAAAVAEEGPVGHVPRGKGLMTRRGGVALEGEEGYTGAHDGDGGAEARREGAAGATAE